MKLKLEDRKKLESMLDKAMPIGEIASKLGTTPSTLYVEIKRNGGIRAYNAEKADVRESLVHKAAGKKRSISFQANKAKRSMQMSTLEERVTNIEKILNLKQSHE